MNRSHTTDSYLLGRAMNTYYQFRTGNSSADFFGDVLVNDVYAPLGLSPTARDTQRTRDAAAQPYAGYGLVYVRDDVVKLAEEARKHKPDLKVLYMTGYSRNAFVHHGRLDEGVSLIQKPFSQGALAEEVQRQF